jgi:uncharacterized protein (TIGR02001 family)
MKKNLRKFTLVGVAALTAATVLARAEDAKVAATLDVPVLSAYVWRGQVLNDKPVLQPSLTVSKAGFSLNTWANFNLNNSYASYAQDNKREFSEIDLTASYSTTVGPLSLGGGIVQYLFPNQTLTTGEGADTVSRAYPGSHEVYATVGLPSVFLAPTLSVYYDFDAADGFYANLAVSQSFELVKDMASLVASASLGAGSKKYNEYYFGATKSAFNDAVLGLAVPVTLPAGWTLKPAVQYVFMPDQAIRDQSESFYGHKDHFIGSITASYAF